MKKVAVDFLNSLTPAEHELLNSFTSFGVTKEDVMTVMYIESGFKPHIVNSIGAMGLFQFLPKTLIGLGFSPSEYRANLNDVGMQLKAFRAFLKKGSFYCIPTEVWRLYLYNFTPAYYKKSEDFVIARMGDKIYAQNKGLDYDGDGFIKVQDIRDYFLFKKRELFG